MTATNTETLEIDGMIVHLTDRGLSIEVTVEDALTMEHATSIAANLVYARGWGDAEVTKRSHWQDRATGTIIYQIEFKL
jgi:hypothetical protein